MSRKHLENKLTLILELTSAVALLLASSAMIAHRAYLQRRSIVNDLRVLAQITANNSMSSLSFNDPDDAAEVLASLEANRDLQAACLYDGSGKVFACYVQPSMAPGFNPPPLRPDGHHMEGRRFVLFHAIEQNAERLGTLMLQLDVQPYYQRIYAEVLFTLLVILIAIALASFVARKMQRRVIGQVAQVVDLANRVAAGALPATMPVHSDDEIGDLVGAFNQIVDATRGVVRQTQTLAHGDYSINIQPRSEQDELSHALIQMTQALKGFHEESTRQNWMKTALSELNKRMRGEQDLGELNRNILNCLAESVEAAAGALFLAEPDGSLGYAAGFAIHSDAARSFRPGEGLVGQAAAEGKILSVRDLAPMPWTIRTGLLDVVPRHLVALPLLRESQVIGVMEWAGAQHFTEEQVELLRQASESIAIAISTAQSRERLNQLLRTTQAQSEELQHQQHALQKTNSELEERTRLLEKQKQEIHRQNRALENAQLDLERKARELATASRYKSEFLANMSHELRTPLNSLLILSKILADNKDGNLSEKQVGFAETIHKAGSDLLTLINDILDLSKVEAGKMEFHIEPVSVRELCDGFESIFRHMAEAKGLQFPVHVDPSAPTSIRTDRQRVGQILRNLLSNAMKFTAKGQVSVRVERPRAAPAAMHPMAVAFAVSDSGIGIPKSKQAAIFGAFQQADGTTSRDYGGTGLGLSISKALAQHLGGELLVESEEGRGSTFTLYLPAVAPDAGSVPAALTWDAAPAAPPATAREPEPAAATSEAREGPMGTAVPILEEEVGDGQTEMPSLLVVEDDARFVRKVIELARQTGFRCSIADDGVEGLAMAERHPPAAIVLGVMLPRLSGREVLRRLKASPATRHIPVFMSSVLERDQETMRMGAIGFLAKPVTDERILEALRQLHHVARSKERRVLVVEDDLRHATTLLNLIRRPGVEVDISVNGKEALDQVRQHRYDCVILDLGLSDVTGFELLEQIDHDTSGRHVPVIVHTGRDLSRDDEAMLRKRAESIVLKTANAADDLMEKVQLYLHLPPERTEAPHPTEPTPPPAPAPLPAPPPQPRREADLKGRRVLIVDDDMRNAYSLAALFDQEGLRHVLAPSGERAIAQLEKDPAIDLVLMDIMMPGMDGYEALREIRKRPRFAKLPIIALTAKAMAGDREKCLEAGASDYLPKPIDVDRLLTLIRQWLAPPVVS